jgi:outer membrane receptor protein involved in Fe transport
LPAFSQSQLVTIEGVVADKDSGKPIEFASVSVIRLPDSITITGTVTDKKGKFSLNKDLPPGSYLIRLSYIGYTSGQQVSFRVPVNPSTLHLGIVYLQDAGKSMREVIVTGKKQTLVTGIDRKVYNVEQDIMSRSGSATDLLKNIPSVEVDIEGQVSLRGSGDVMILINGKPSPLMGRSKAEILAQLPANSIERIEVITNPSARYRPDGTSGIINIVLKKNIKNGFNGTAILNAGNRERFNGNVTLNYKPKKVNLFGSYSLRQDSRRRFNTIERVLNDSMGIPEGYFNQSSEASFRPLSNNFNGGIDYTINEHNSTGVSGSYFHRKLTRRDISSNHSYDANKILTGNYDRLRYDPEFEKQHDIAFYFQHQFAREEHELRLEFNTSVSDEVEDNHFSTFYQLPVNTTSYDNTRIGQLDKENQLTIDYTNPLSEDSKLEAGYDGLYNEIDLDFYGEYLDTMQHSFVKDIEKTNRFVYNENIHAIYLTYEKTFEKWGYSAGLRAEQAFTKSHLMTLDSSVRNNYFHLYPTVHFSYALKKGSELQLNYSRRVNRPDGDELNPFPEYQDPRNLRAGNPKLLPEIIHSVELGYKWQDAHFSFVPSIYFRYKKHGFTSVTIPLNDSTLLTTTQNLSNDRSMGLELIFSAKTGTWFSANLSSNIFYNRINADNLGYIQNKSIISMSTNLSTNFNFSKTTLMQVSANYRSARLTPQGKSYPSFVMNTGIRQDLFRNKISMTLTLSDLFASLRQKSELVTPELRQTSMGRRDGRIIYLGISYRFGLIKKQKEEKLQFDENL